MNPVSIVIPCFNLGEYLPEAVESARQQTCPPSEIIIVDDGSTDAQTLKVLGGYSKEGLLVFHTTNQGAPAARNYGINQAKSDYVLCVDADDVLMPSFLEETVPKLDEMPEVGMVATGVEFFGERTGTWRPRDYAPDIMLWQNCIPSASLFRKVCWHQVGGYKDLGGCQDWEFWLSIMERGWTWTVVPKYLYRYRQRRGSISEYRESNRPHLLRQIIDLHADTYKAHCPDILVGLDTELQRVRDRVKKYEQDTRTQAEMILTLKQSLNDMKHQARGMSNGSPHVTSSHGTSVTPAAMEPNPLHTDQVKQLVSSNGSKNDSTNGIPAISAANELSTVQIDQLNGDVRRKVLIQQIQEVVNSKLPPEAKVMVVSRGDDELLDLGGRQGWHFPQTEDGVYSGHYPGSSAEAIEHLEALRAKGGGFLLFPRTALWWLEYYREFAQYLERHYRVVVRDDACLIFDARSEKEQHTFSVVICTYKRAEFLGKAIESLFNQDYPKDKFEIIIINNNSPDHTEAVAQHYANRSPVPFSYFVEEKQGLSFARNLGVEKAKYEYVAFLDDDATACTNWLSAFNFVINEHRALVVGGRVEKAFEEDFVAPDWFQYQYLKGFFGVNYRERGRKERIFRIRPPLYIGGGNSAYAKRLYDSFGSYDPRLGRDDKTLLAAEETSFNLVLDKYDIPIYYTDDAVIYHFIESYRVTKEHLKRKAYWSGISNAIMYVMIYGYKETLNRTKNNWSELKRLVEALRRLRGNPEAFSKVCRIIYTLAFLYKFYRLYIKHLFTGRQFPPRQVSWMTQNWIDEFSRWPDGEEKYTQLYNLYLSQGDAKNARETLIKLTEYLSKDRLSSPETPSDRSVGPVRRLQYEQLIQRIREVVKTALPLDAKVLVITKGDDELLKLDGRQGWHFPQTEQGVYAGHYPAHCVEAIAHLEALRTKGAEFLLLPNSALWWLDHYPEFKQHLESNYQVVTRQENTCLIYALGQPAIQQHGIAIASSAGSVMAA